MSLFEYVISEVIAEIPEEVLTRAFRTENQHQRFGHFTLEDKIMSLVIRPRLFIDCNLISGEDALIDLMHAERYDPDSYSSVYRIPKKITNGRSIVVAKQVSFLNPNSVNSFGVHSPCGRSALLLGVKAVMDAQEDIPFVGTHKVRLIGENTILIRGGSLLPTSSYPNCTLEYDKNMSNISPRSYGVLAEAGILAVKAYIYRTLHVTLGEGELMAGMALNQIGNVVDSYSDANEQYREFRRTRLAKVLYMQDDERMERHMKRIVGGYR